MRETVSVLRLNPQQLAQLITHCVAYRGYLWQYIMPTSARNQMIRGVQALQGRLEKAQEHRRMDVTLSLHAEEGAIFQQLFNALMQWYGTAPPSEERLRRLGELASLHLLIAQTLRSTRAL